MSLLPFGVIVATLVAVATIAAVVLVAAANIALSTFVVALAVVTTTFLAVDVALVFDCCVPLPQEEDHHLPPPSGKAPSWPLLPSFVDCPHQRRTMPLHPHHSFASAGRLDAHE
jgi:hypothetical protein